MKQATTARLRILEVALRSKLFSLTLSSRIARHRMNARKNNFCVMARRNRSDRRTLLSHALASRASFSSRALRVDAMSSQW